MKWLHGNTVIKLERFVKGPFTDTVFLPIDFVEVHLPEYQYIFSHQITQV